MLVALAKVYVCLFSFFFFLLIWIKSIFWHKMSCFHKPRRKDYTLSLNIIGMDDTRKLNWPQTELNNKNTYILDYMRNCREIVSHQCSKSGCKYRIYNMYMQIKCFYYDLEFLIRIIPFKNDKWSHLHRAICIHNWINQ